MTLLTMQAESLNNSEATAALQDASARVESMMVLYNKLYRREKYTEISIKEYLSNLIGEIFQLFPDEQNIKIKTEIDEFPIGSKQMFPLGLIVNELLTNAMKYAFVKVDSGLIQISITKIDNHVTFIFGDNGIGMPKSKADNNGHKGFGLTLIELLIDQIEGNYKIETNNGTKFIIEFEL